MTPQGAGRLEVYLDGEKIFDRKEDEGRLPQLAQGERVEDDRGREGL